MKTSFANAFQFVSSHHFVSIFVLCAVYVGLGLFSWANLCSHATTAEELEFVVSPSASVWARVGQSVMVLTWPLWTVGAWFAFKAAKLFRSAAPRFLTYP